MALVEAETLLGRSLESTIRSTRVESALTPILNRSSLPISRCSISRGASARRICTDASGCAWVAYPALICRDLHTCDPQIIEVSHVVPHESLTLHHLKDQRRAASV